MKTLEQLLLRRGGTTTIAACDIVDWPDFEIRGFMNIGTQLQCRCL